jgi:hypothetical protein
MHPNGGENPDQALAAALRAGAPRFFRASRGMAKGHTGPEDTARFAENLMVLQECALLLGERLGMRSVSRAALCDGDDIAAFAYEPNTDPANPDVVGVLVNRRTPLRKLFAELAASTAR